MAQEFGATFYMAKVQVCGRGKGGGGGQALVCFKGLTGVHSAMANA